MTEPQDDKPDNTGNGTSSEKPRQSVGQGDVEIKIDTFYNDKGKAEPYAAYNPATTMSSTSESSVSSRPPAPVVRPQGWASQQKPVRERHLIVYKILGALAIVLFFPTGIPAFYTAMKLEEDYYEGINHGNMDQCNKRARILEKFLLLSFALCLFTVILALALVGGLGTERGLSGVHL